MDIIDGSQVIKLKSIEDLDTFLVENLDDVKRELTYIMFVNGRVLAGYLKIN